MFPNSYGSQSLVGVLHACLSIGRLFAGLNNLYVILEWGRAKEV